MSYECSNCGEYWWSDDCPREYSGGGSGYIVCPDCGGNLKMVIGPVEEDILEAMARDEPLSQNQIANRTDIDKEVVSDALRHLIDMHYVGSTPNWNYKRGSKGREYTD